jgi:hypothetical protein
MADRPPDTGFAGLDALGVDVADALRADPGAAPSSQPTPPATPHPTQAGASPRAQPYQGDQSKRGAAKLVTGGTIALLVGIGVIAALAAIGALTEDRTTETMPQVGTGITLTRAEIRYCLAEQIRLQGAQAVLNRSKGDDIGRFNAMVDDYNSRCSSFRYRSGDLESARSDVEPGRERLRADGAGRFGR